MTDDKVDPNKEEAEAIGRLAYTDDGRLLHRYLRRVLEGVMVIADQSTLLTHNGHRSLARDLMRLMAEGIEARRDGSSADQPILTRTDGAVAVAHTRGTRRRVPESLPEPGPDDATGAS